MLPLPNNIDWQVESIRVTAFLNGPLNPNMLERWLTEVSQNVPSQLSKKPSSFSGVSRFTAGFLQLNWSGNRLDVILSAEEPQSRETICPFIESTPLFEQVVRRVPEIGELATVDRLAIGLILTRSVENEAQGIELISPLIVGINLPRTVRDFLYRVNYPSVLQTHNNLNINRLAAWSVGQLQLVHLQINMDGTQDQQVITQHPWALRLELDINTHKDVHLAADQEVLGGLIFELSSIARQIASDGEASLRE